MDTSSPTGYFLSSEFAGSGVGPDLFLALPAQFPAFKDGDARVKLRFDDKAVGIGGLLARYRDAEDYYAATVDIAQNELALLRVARRPHEHPRHGAPGQSGEMDFPSLFPSTGTTSGLPLEGRWSRPGTTPGPTQGGRGLLTDAVSAVDFTDYQTRPAQQRR